MFYKLLLFPCTCSIALVHVLQSAFFLAHVLALVDVLQSFFGSLNRYGMTQVVDV
jgi:hypothetical protein